MDGQENPVSTIVGAKLFEVQKYLTLSYHQYNPQSIVVSKKFWDSLSAGDQKILEEAAQESIRYQREQSRSQLASAWKPSRRAAWRSASCPRPK